MTTSYTDQVAARVEQEAEYLPPASPPEAQTEEITSDFVLSCLDENELGDGRLYSALHRDKLVYVKRWDKKPWLMWNGHHWKRDDMGLHMTMVDNVAKTYIKEAAALVPNIKRQRGLLDQANELVATCNKQAKELNKRSDVEQSDRDKVDAEGKEAEASARKHSIALKALQRQQKELNDRASRLRSIRGAKCCVEWSHLHDKPLAIHGKEIDQQPWLLACPNGVINLQDGEFRPGKQSDYLVRTVNVEWPIHLGEKAIEYYLVHGTLPDGSDPHPTWTRFKNDIQPDKDVLACMDRIMGYATTGFGAREQHIIVFLGKGRNGKGTYLKTIQRILGDLAWAIQPEFILEEKNPRSTASASPDIVMLQGRRVIIASENDDKQKISAAKVKRFTGGNKINARGLFAGEEENFDPTWTMFLETNHVPEGLTKDFAMRQRLILVDFPWLYVQDPEDMAQREPWNKKRFKLRDPELEDKLQQEDQYILLDLVRSCLVWQATGSIAPPDRIKANVEDLAVAEDVLQQFMNSCCLTDWTQFRVYQEGECCQVPSEGTYGTRYRATDKPFNKGYHPESDIGREYWAPDGVGCRPDNETLFKEFYSRFKIFYEETQSDNERYRITKKEVGKRLRERGFDVRNKGRGTVITGNIEVLQYVE